MARAEPKGVRVLRAQRNFVTAGGQAAEGNRGAGADTKREVVEGRVPPGHSPTWAFGGGVCQALRISR
jgi:hypothetical protein